jgi:hypothetical protein
MSVARHTDMRPAEEVSYLEPLLAISLVQGSCCFQGDQAKDRESRHQQYSVEQIDLNRHILRDNHESETVAIEVGGLG